MRPAGIALMVVLGFAGVVCFVLMAGDTSPAERAADGAMLLVIVAVAYGASYLVWPRAAR